MPQLKVRECFFLSFVQGDHEQVLELKSCTSQ